jgi:hypothetical protein
MARHLFDGLSLREIARLEGHNDHKIVSRRLEDAILKLLAAGMHAACVNHQRVKVIAVSKLGQEFDSRHPALKELNGEA